jgi:hypothetical protein
MSFDAPNRNEDEIAVLSELCAQDIDVGKIL